ncbi:RNA methyltransferase, RsmD family [Orientia chuto str. Dubai]|uniref:RNA methyltransferase, RsmD family n=1 Tax=Orientia chuto str. Dubai TaxID=1359168 RepID=A0A0F3MJ66_9RICK|nr:16S rRNA (guanine(966)-N(2))-methyltransferase RsmD [Candidatus Orientia mediorientalis]KJV55790.1 RNA methyltransferase, RsmD family [Orientia chuto str. Dubai]
MVRIISGKLKGQKIPVIKNNNYRPSTSRLKESVFNILSTQSFNKLSTKIELSEIQMLDLFTGTGNIAFEALSRGIQHVTLIDMNINCLRAIQSHACKINIYNKITLLKLDATNLPQAHHHYNVVFMDPPFYKELINKTLLSLCNKSWLDNNTMLFIESELSHKLALPLNFHFQTERIYGKSKLTVLLYTK